MSRVFAYDFDTVRFFPPGPVIDVHVSAPDTPENSQTLSILIDTGADASILPINVLQQIQAPLTRMATIRGIHDIGRPTSLYHVAMRIGDYTLDQIEVASTTQPSQVVIGRDVLTYMVVTFDGPAGATLITK